MISPDIFQKPPVISRPIDARNEQTSIIPSIKFDGRPTVWTVNVDNPPQTPDAIIIKVIQDMGITPDSGEALLWNAAGGETPEDIINNYLAIGKTSLNPLIKDACATLSDPSVSIYPVAKNIGIGNGAHAPVIAYPFIDPYTRDLHINLDYANTNFLEGRQRAVEDLVYAANLAKKTKEEAIEILTNNPDASFEDLQEKLIQSLEDHMHVDHREALYQEALAHIINLGLNPLLLGQDPVMDALSKIAADHYETNNSNEWNDAADNYLGYPKPLGKEIRSTPSSL